MVVSKITKTFKILKNGKIRLAAINNVKPCYSLKIPLDMTSGSPVFAIESDLVSRQPSLTLNLPNHTDMEQNIYAADDEPNVTLNTKEVSSSANNSTDVPLVSQYPFTYDDSLASSFSTNASLTPQLVLDDCPSDFKILLLMNSFFFFCFSLPKTLCIFTYFD